MKSYEISLLAIVVIMIGLYQIASLFAVRCS